MSGIIVICNEKVGQGIVDYCLGWISDQSLDSEEAPKGQAEPSSSRRITRDSFDQLEEYKEEEGGSLTAPKDYLEFLSPTTRNLHPEIQGSQLD